MDPLSLKFFGPGPACRPPLHLRVCYSSVYVTLVFLNILPSNPRALGYEYPGIHRGRGYALDGGSRKSIGLTTQWREGSFYVFFFYLFTSAVIIKYWSSGALARFIKSSWRVLSLFIHSLSFSLSLLHRILSGTFTIFIDSPPNHLTTQTNVIHETKIMFKKYFFLITILFLIFSLSTGLAHPIPDSSQAGRRNLMLMGRTVHFFDHDVAISPRELSAATREEKLHHRMNQRRYMPMRQGLGASHHH